MSSCNGNIAHELNVLLSRSITHFSSVNKLCTSITCHYPKHGHFLNVLLLEAFTRSLVHNSPSPSTFGLYFLKWDNFIPKHHQRRTQINFIPKPNVPLSRYTSPTPFFAKYTQSFCKIGIRLKALWSAKKNSTKFQHS